MWNEKKDFICTKMRIDHNDQWFVYLWLLIGSRKLYIEFKVDTGCNALVLSHKTLKKLGISVADLSKLPNTTGVQASGEKHDYKRLGKVSAFHDKTTHICDTSAVCHATRETHDLLGTAVLKESCRVNFILDDLAYMELYFR
ncbi:MAG: hypothetical protein FWF80_07740 [Defluviitaleaceae bacterium]|nr:hypothetical protein [Defluviitaleaceae bacterium]